VVFVDGQNLYHAVKREFGYSFPNYDPLALARYLCTSKGWALHQVRFYTGIPAAADNPFWNSFWSAKLLALSRAGVWTYSRTIRYRMKSTRLYGGITVHLPNGSAHPAGTKLYLGDGSELPDGTDLRVRVADEKGTDIRIAVDIIRLAHANEYDVGLILSQDQDLSEAASEIRFIAREQKRWIRLASAFPCSAGSRFRKGIDKTDWIPIDKADYDTCIDSTDYRPSAPPSSPPPPAPPSTGS
jgi:uncharacterized LabA/DUF88 family protein